MGPPIFALAMTASYGDDQTRRFALPMLPAVATTGSHLQMFVDYIGSMRGWGQGLRTAISEWYYTRILPNLVYLAVEYRRRYGWTRGDPLSVPQHTLG